MMSIASKAADLKEMVVVKPVAFFSKLNVGGCE